MAENKVRCIILSYKFKVTASGLDNMLRKPENKAPQTCISKFLKNNISKALRKKDSPKSKEWRLGHPARRRNPRSRTNLSQWKHRPPISEETEFDSGWVTKWWGLKWSWEPEEGVRMMWEIDWLINERGGKGEEIGESRSHSCRSFRNATLTARRHNTRQGMDERSLDDTWPDQKRLWMRSALMLFDGGPVKATS